MGIKILRCLKFERYCILHLTLFSRFFQSVLFISDFVLFALKENALLNSEKWHSLFLKNKKIREFFFLENLLRNKHLNFAVSWHDCQLFCTPLCVWAVFGSVFLKGEAVPFIVYPTTAPYIRLWLCPVLQVSSIQMNGSVLLFQAQPQLYVSIEGDAAFAKTLQPLYGIGDRSTTNQILMAYPNYRPSILKVRENPFRSVYMEWLQSSK